MLHADAICRRRATRGRPASCRRAHDRRSLGARIRARGTKSRDLDVSPWRRPRNGARAFSRAGAKRPVLQSLHAGRFRLNLLGLVVEHLASREIPHALVGGMALAAYGFARANGRHRSARDVEIERGRPAACLDRTGGKSGWGRVRDGSDGHRSRLAPWRYGQMSGNPAAGVQQSWPGTQRFGVNRASPS